MEEAVQCEVVVDERGTFSDKKVSK